MHKSLNILLIEDSPVDRDLVKEYLEDTIFKGYQISEAEKLKEGQVRLESSNFDVLLLDLSLPDSFGLDGLKNIKNSKSDLPVIILTGLEDHKVALEAIRNGAQDYLVKGNFDSSILERVIRYSVERTSIESKLKESEEYFRHLTEYSTDITLVLDEDMRIQYASLAANRLLGYQIREMVGNSMYAYLAKDSHAVFEQYMQDCAKNKGMYQPVELTVEKKDGEEMFIETQANIFGSGLQKGFFILNARNITERKIAEKKLLGEHEKALRYQSRLLTSQINPHFIFNALNSVQFYILDEQPEPALNFIAEFSSLMRRVLNNSTKEKITLAEEIEFLEMYLNLERKRFRDKFTFSIEVDDEIDIDSETIVPMLLQPYAENTVVHGVGNLQGKGVIQIKFTDKGEYIQCTIEDNGVGREKAMELKQLRIGNEHKSMAMGITDLRLELLNKLGLKQYESVVVDKLESGKVVGTKVIISIPKLVDP